MRLFSGLVVCLGLFSGVWSSHALGLKDTGHDEWALGTVGWETHTEFNPAEAHLLSSENTSNSSSSAVASTSSSSSSSSTSSSLAENDDNDDNPALGGDLLPDEIWLSIAQYFDTDTWLNFIRTCRDFYRVGTDPIAIGYTFLNEAMNFINLRQYEHACFRCWQGVFSMLHHLDLLDDASAESISKLLNPDHPNPGRAILLLSLSNLDLSNTSQTSRHLLMHLWIQGTLLLSVGDEDHAAFIHTLATASHRSPHMQELADAAAFRLCAPLNGHGRSAQILSASLVGLRFLLSEHMLSFDAERSTIITLIMIVANNSYSNMTRYIATQQLQTMLRNGVFSEQYQRFVFRAIIQTAGDPRLSLRGRMLILNTLDDSDINGMLTPELRGHLLESIPMFIRSDVVGDMAGDYLSALLRANTLNAEELVPLGNSLRPLIYDASTTVRIRVVHLLTEGVLNIRLPYSFKQACVRALLELLKDSSPEVQAATRESLIRLQRLPLASLPEILIHFHNGDSPSSSSS